MLIGFESHPLQYSGISSGCILRNYPWPCSGNHMGSRRELGRHQTEVSYLYGKCRTYCKSLWSGIPLLNLAGLEKIQGTRCSEDKEHNQNINQTQKCNICSGHIDYYCKIVSLCHFIIGKLKSIVSFLKHHNGSKIIH